MSVAGGLPRRGLPSRPPVLKGRSLPRSPCQSSAVPFPGGTQTPALPSGSSWSGHGCEPSDRTFWTGAGEREQARSLSPASSRTQADAGLCQSAAPSRQAVWPWDGGMLGVPASPRKPPLKLPVVSSFSSETGKCLSRAKASPRAQLSCSKVGGVESCSLSCPAPTHFVPGNPRPSPDGVGDRGSSPARALLQAGA